jgi:hypothetical protein
MKTAILVVIMSLCVASAQAAIPTWVCFSAGAGTVGSSGSSDGWIGSRVAVQWSNGSNLWTLATSGCNEFDIFGSREPAEYVRDYGVLFGKRYSGPVGFLSASAGLALVSGMRRGEYEGSDGGWLFGTSYYEEKPFVTIGVPVDVQLTLAPFKVVGLALDFFGNLNPKRSFAGATLSLLIGQLR